MEGVSKDVMAHIPVTAGDSVLLMPGTIHALGKGILAAEIQVNSDLTYRLYDWGRVGLDGKPRRQGKRKLTRADLDAAFWSSEFLSVLPAEAWQTDSAVLA